jgi:hypothetical protein
MKLLLALLLPLTPAQAGGGLLMANYDVDYNVPAFGYNTCSYKQVYGYSGDPLRVKVVVQGLCPYTIKYDPVTGTWSR